VESRGGLHGALGIAITARDVAKRKLLDIGAGVERILLLVFRGAKLSSASREACLVFRRQDFRPSQIIFCINVLLLRLLRFACALLARGCCGILRLLRAAT
jgi:hypothetical protein